MNAVSTKMCFERVNWRWQWWFLAKTFAVSTETNGRMMSLNVWATISCHNPVSNGVGQEPPLDEDTELSVKNGIVPIPPLYEVTERSVQAGVVREQAVFRWWLRTVSKSGYCSDSPSLTDIHPSQFNSVIKAVQKVAGFNETTCNYLTPSLALKIGHSLRQCAEIKEAQGLMDSDPDERQAAEDFLKLCSSLWSAKVGSHAVTTLSDKSYNKTQILPVAGDLQKLQVYLEKSIETQVSALKNCPNPEAWWELAKAVETNLVLFNRSRSGEVQRLTLTDYQHINDNPVESGLIRCFTSVEQKLASLMKRIEIKGKKVEKFLCWLHHPCQMPLTCSNDTFVSWSPWNEQSRFC